jgi:hypothetical protein
MSVIYHMRSDDLPLFSEEKAGEVLSALVPLDLGQACIVDMMVAATFAKRGNFDAAGRLHLYFPYIDKGD